MSSNYIRLKKGEDRRIRSGHPWIYSNEIDTQVTPLRDFSAGQEVIVQAHDQSILGIAYINPHSLISARMMSTDSHQPLDLDFFIERFKQAKDFRQSLFSKPFYRLIFSEADGLPGLVVDRFGNDFVAQINTAGMELKTDLITQAICNVFPDAHSILLRNDSPIRTHEGLIEEIKAAFGEPPEEIELEENGVQFTAPLYKGQKTGWFYDHRLNRARLQHYVQNKNVLDVFSYVGGWGIQAAAFGAKHVDCIEASEQACAFIQKNALINHVQDKVSVICDDAFVSMKQLLQSGKQYEVIILDPPAFVKKAKDRKEGLIAYQRINELALKLLVPNGILFTCSCSMHISMQDLIEITQRVAYRTQSRVQIIERGHQGPDHPIHVCIPETEYLKALMIRKI